MSMLSPQRPGKRMRRITQFRRRRPDTLRGRYANKVVFGIVQDTRHRALGDSRETGDITCRRPFGPGCRGALSGSLNFGSYQIPSFLLGALPKSDSNYVTYDVLRSGRDRQSNDSIRLQSSQQCCMIVKIPRSHDGRESQRRLTVNVLCLRSVWKVLKERLCNTQ